MKTEIERIYKKKDNILRLYHKPELIAYGEMRDVTLGGSPGSGDSTNSMTQKPPAFGGRNPEAFGPP